MRKGQHLLEKGVIPTYATLAPHLHTGMLAMCDPKLLNNSNFNCFNINLCKWGIVSGVWVQRVPAP